MLIWIQYGYNTGPLGLSFKTLYPIVVPRIILSFLCSTCLGTLIYPLFIALRFFLSQVSYGMYAIVSIRLAFCLVYFQ